MEEPRVKIRVFISYSRKDRAIAERLRTRLIDDGVDAFLDAHDIVKGEPWQERLQNLIFTANVVVFLISPDSVASEICDWEINEAERIARRILPVVCRATLDKLIPRRLKRLNYAFLDTEERWAMEYPDLCKELNRDIAWVREHTRLTELAARWHRDGRPDAQLLRLDAVREARRWETRRPIDATLGELTLSFLEASEDKEIKDRDRLLTINGRAFVKPAQQALADGRYDAALRLAAAGILLGEDFDMLLVPERAQSGISAAERQALRCVLRGHEQEVTRADFSPDGSFVLTTGQWDQTARLWDAHSGRETATLRGHSAYLMGAAFSPDGTRVVTASRDHTAAVWEVATGRQLLVLRGHSAGLRSAKFNVDGTRIVTSSGDGTYSVDQTARVWDAVSGREISVLRGHKRDVWTAEFSPDGSVVVTASEDHTVRLWDADSGRERAVLRGHTSYVSGAIFSPDGTLVASASQDGSARLWDAQTAKEVAVMTGRIGLRVPVFSPDGARLLLPFSDPRIVDTASRAEVAVMRGHTRSAGWACFSADGTRVATCSEDRTARICDAATGAVLAVMRGHERHVNSVSFSPDGTRIVTASADQTARIWDAAIGESDRHGVGILSGPFGSMSTASFSHNDQRIVTASMRAHVWDAEMSKPIVEIKDHYGWTRSAVFNSDATLVLSAGDTTARLWDAFTGEHLSSFDHQDEVQSAAFSPDGRRVVTACSDRLARIFDASSGDLLTMMEGHTRVVRSAVFSTDGVKVVTASLDNTARIWDARTGQEILQIRVADDDWDIRHAVLSVDGSLLATASKQARIWDVRSGRELKVLRGHDEVVATVCFSNDGKRLMTASWDNTARIWDVGTGCEIAVLRGHKDWINSATFNDDGLRAVTASKDQSARIWDVGATAALAGSVVEALAASLSNGRGVKTDEERADLLMQSAPDDLYGALLERMTPTQRERVAWRTAILSAARARACYVPASAPDAALTPVQF